jgi:glycosyltransferase involved in cell wall biosynthesis
MKVHYLTLAFDEGHGGYRVIINVLNRLASRGHEVTVTTMLPSHMPFTLNKKICFNQINFSKLNFLVLGACRILRKFSGYDLDGYAAIRKSVSKFVPDCDINIAHSCGDVFPLYESHKGVTLHYMQHDEVLITNDAYGKAVCEEAYNLPIKRIVNSLWLRQRLNKRYGLDLPIVTPAINHNIFFPRKVSKKSNKRIVMCFGGRGLKWKGFNDALEAMNIVKKSIENLEFRVYGRKPFQIQEQFSYVFYKNPTDEELAELYRSSDVTICPSWFESFPLPPLEAMACGCPTVTTRYGTEDYAFNEKNSLVVPPRNPKAMANAIIRLLQDDNLCEQFRKEGPKTAKMFTWERTVDTVEEIFETFKSS